MKKFAIALAAFVSLGLAIPAFAMEKKEMPAEKKMVVHHHHHHHASHDETRTETVMAAISRTAGLVLMSRGEHRSVPRAASHHFG